VFQAKYVFTSVVPTEEGCMPWWSFTRVVWRKNWCVTRNSRLWTGLPHK
jgi:hypothetical protein